MLTQVFTYPSRHSVSHFHPVTPVTSTERERLFGKKLLSYYIGNHTVHYCYMKITFTDLLQCHPVMQVTSLSLI